MQWSPFGQFLNKGPDDMSYSTVSFGSIYGPAGGHAQSVEASRSASVVQRASWLNFSAAHLALPTLIVFGIAVWWSLHQFK
jgi:hypothetical protein